MFDTTHFAAKKTLCWPGWLILASMISPYSELVHKTFDQYIDSWVIK